MVKKIIKSLLFVFALSFLCTGCANSEKKTNVDSINKEEDKNDDEGDKKEKDKAQHRTYAYKATYELKKGDYIFESGHTHKHNIFVTFIKEANDDVDKKAAQIMEQESIAYKKKDKVNIEENKLYRFRTAHYDGKIYITIPEDAKWIMVTDIPPGEALPYHLSNKDGEEIKPISTKVVDNKENEIYKGYFKDEDIKDRELSEWKGYWKSVYPYLEDGSLDKVMEAKSKNGKMTKEEYKEYYKKGYTTDVEKILIKEDNHISFTKGKNTYTAEYKYDGYKILEYKKGNRGVRFLFTKINGDKEAPTNIQFSDHNIYPTKPMHFHLFFGDKSHEELLKEMDNWPTYYPENMDKDEIVHDMLSH